MGFIINDIMIKGIITHVEDVDIDAMIDGGFIQQVGMMQKKFVPGGSEMPFVNEPSSDTATSVMK